MFYWKSANLIGSTTVFYSLMENDPTGVAVYVVAFPDFWPNGMIIYCMFWTVIF